MSARKSACMLFLLLLTVTSFGASTTYKIDDPRQKLVEKQRKENKESEQEAIKLEQELVTLANQYLKDKEFAKAAQYYRRALDITYSVWDIKELEVGGIKMPQPAVRKVKMKLNTNYTRTARDKLGSIDEAVEAEEQAAAKKKLEKMFEDADVATMLGNLGKAYAAYQQIIGAAAAYGEKKFAVESAIKAQKKQAEILANAVKPLDEAEKLIKEGKPAEAIAALENYETTWATLMATAPELKSRYDRLLASPELRQEQRELEVRKRIQIGDAAFAREDYILAARHYRAAVTLHPETAASRTAAEKLAKMQADPKIVEAMKQQEVEAKCKPILMRAEAMLKMNKFDEAKAECDRIVAEHPGTKWAEQAQELLKAIEEQKTAPAETPAEPGV